MAWKHQTVIDRYMTCFFRLLQMLAFCAAGVCLSGGAAAQSSARVVTDHAVSIVQPEQLGFSPGETTWFAFRQELEDGWHVYWKNPGDSGLPLSFNWELPGGFEAGEILYPAPERIPVGPFVNFGHHGEPVFLVPITAPEDAGINEEIPVRLNAEWLICEEICVPESGTFDLTLTVLEAVERNPVAARHFDRFRSEASSDLPNEARFYAEANALTLVVKDAAAESDVFFFPASEGVVEPSAAQNIVAQDGDLILALAPGLSYSPNGIEQLDGVLQLGQRKFAVAAKRAAGAAPSVSQNGDAGATSRIAPVGLLLIGAFLGGVLLNVMPCVFPILFVKATSFANAAHDRRILRRHGLLYASGVLATFGLLAALLLLLRAGGEQLGWGFHLQSPIVVLLSAYILFLVGLNFAGVFSIGESAQNVGESLASKTGDAGAFFTGALAVFVAAPCVGPFLSAPIGAAALLPPAIGMAIFLAMALGFALPFTLLSFAPWFARSLPKPGAWMSTLKTALSFPVFAGAAFFVWVLSQQASAGGFALALGGLVLLAFAAWAFEKSKGASVWRAAAIGALAIALAPMLALGGAGAAASSAATSSTGLEWSELALKETRANGNGVFVDFTAAWCVTCQVNKVTVLSRASLKTLFDDNNVTLLTADWTRRDPAITEVLQSFGANGVPFYVYYPPKGAPRVIELPLTEARIAAAIEG